MILVPIKSAYATSY